MILPAAQMSRADSAKAIERAIDRGVPMFNHGNAAGTAAIYKSVSERLMRSGGLNGEERARLEMGLMQAADARNASASAWQLRYALDDVNASLHNNGRMMVRTAMSQ